MKLRGKFTSDGSFIAEGEDIFNPERLAEKLVEITIEIVPKFDSNSMSAAKEISAMQGVALEVAIEAMATYGKFGKTPVTEQA